MKSKYLLVTLLGVVALSLTGCNKSKRPDPFETDEILYKGENLYFNPSDDKMMTFLNDFTHRNMRYDKDSCGEFPVTGGTGFAKNWESMAVTFQNASKQVYREDKIERIANYLLGASQDDQGLIYNTPMTFEPAFSVAGNDPSGYCVPQGWPFPFWQSSVNNYFDYGSLEAVHTTEFNFNDAGHEQSKNWQAQNGSFQVGLEDEQTGYGYFSTPGSIATNASFRFYKSDLASMLTFCSGIDTRYAPMIDIEFGYTGTNVADYGICFKVQGDDTEYFAPQSVYASTVTTNTDGVIHVRQFIDMYLMPEWNRKIVTEIGVKFLAKEGKKLNVKDGYINYLRPTYDTRQSNATYQFILALYNYYIFTRDIKTLTKLMNKARKGILFLSHALEGEKGLLSLEYLYGHDGMSPYTINNHDRLAYHGVGNGYWDLTVSPIINLEANTYYYQALRAMAILEEAMEYVDNDDVSNVSVKNRMPNEPAVKYQFNKETLNSLADLVKSKMEQDVNPVREDGGASYTAGDIKYVNKGGFYNPSTGRFVLGINEYNGQVLDYGYTYLNLEAVCAGIGSGEQQLSIMNWVDGSRTVSGDTSTGKDIYFYEFAPRYNTLDCNDSLGFMRDENFYGRFYKDGFDTWSRQLQNGGAAIAWSYYDLVARSKVLGVNNALNRLDVIKKWYTKVLDNGGSGYNFYDDYYDNLQSELEAQDYQKWYMVYSVQDAANRGGGSLGLDAEFIESVILIRSIPDALYGMDATDYNNLQFTYLENKMHKYFEIYNMKYGEAIYSLRSKKNIIEIFNISGVVDKNYTVTFKYPTSKTNLKVTVNGEAFNNVRYENGYALVTLPFSNVRVIFG